MNKDDQTSLRQLSNKDLVAYVVGKEQLSEVELELVLRLEQIVDQHSEVKEKLPKLPCSTCPVLPHLLPRDTEDALAELKGDTQWA